jgi:nitroreductase
VNTVQEPRLEALRDVIANRRSLGLARLKEDVIDPVILRQALESANWAPSNGDTEPWRFTVFTGESRKELGEVFAEAYKQDAESDGDFRPETHQAMLERGTDAPVWISIGMEPGRRPDGSLAMTEEDENMAVACAVQNLHLVLTAHGLVGMWHSKGSSVHPHTAKYLGLEAPSRLLGFFWAGYPKVEWPEGERGPWEDKVVWKS